MTLLETRKMVLREMAVEVNERYFKLLEDIENGFISVGEISAVRAKIEEFESLTSYIRSEFETLNRDEVGEAAREVETIWAKSGAKI